MPIELHTSRYGRLWFINAYFEFACLLCLGWLRGHGHKRLDVDTTSTKASPVQGALSDSTFACVKVITQFVSQVLPPSSENACSKRHESGVMSEKPFRT